MYSARSAGKGTARYFDARFSEIVQARHRHESELRDAVEHRQFVVHYQPRVDVASGAVMSMEALVRWMHPRRGLVCPNDFIALAEESGLIVPLGEQVIDQACTQVAHWSHEGAALVPISINASPKQFQEVDVPALVAKYLARHDVRPELIEIELTESSMIENGLHVADAILALRNMGRRRRIGPASRHALPPELRRGPGFLHSTAETGERTSALRRYPRDDLSLAASLEPAALFRFYMGMHGFRSCSLPDNNFS